MKKWLAWAGGAAVVVVLISLIYISIEDAGTLSVHYADSKQPYHQQLRTSLETWKGFDAAAAELDAALLLPQDIGVWFADCGENNAFYNRESKQVVLCYELVSDLVRVLRPLARSDSALATAVWHTTFFVFYHEIGHALIDILDLPTTGREEDAVDQLATLLLLNGGAAGRDAALQGANWFLLSSRRGQRTPFWDEHSLEAQRYYNVLCWVYGSNPQVHQVLLRRDWGLPRARAELCPAEFQRIYKAWDAVLDEHTF